MTIFPLPLSQLFGHWGAYVVYLLVGFAFGAVLEMSGFGNSRKLAAQFYFKEMTVLKVMFTGIIVAMVLIFAASGLGLLDYNLIWVNPTYLWPGIVGGLIMGVGFIIGGFCPGTSMVAASTLKVDGMFFLGGIFFGIFMFGETVSKFAGFWNSSYMGRFTLMDWLGLPTGVIVLLAVAMALFMFWGGEQLEKIFGDADPKEAPKWRYGAAGVIALAAAGLIVVGQPTNTDRWNMIAAEKEAQLDGREVQIHPAELVDNIRDKKIKVVMLDVRDEADYNVFHILDAENVPLESIDSIVPELHLEPANTVFVLMSNDEKAATEAWKILVAESVPNVYILEGGINNWIDTFADEDFRTAFPVNAAAKDDQLRYEFDAALGDQLPTAVPPLETEIEYTSKVKLELKRAPSSGGCG